MFPALALGRALRGRGRDVAPGHRRRGARYVGTRTAVHRGRRRQPVRQLAGAAARAGPARPRPAAAVCSPCAGSARSRPRPSAATPRCRRRWPRRCSRVPLLVHEQNAVFGRANRLTGPLRARRGPELRADLRRTGPSGPAAAAHRQPDAPRVRAAWPQRRRPVTGFRVLVLGGSQGARVFSDVVPGGRGAAARRTARSGWIWRSSAGRRISSGFAPPTRRLASRRTRQLLRRRAGADGRGRSPGHPLRRLDRGRTAGAGPPVDPGALPVMPPTTTRPPTPAPWPTPVLPCWCRSRRSRPSGLSRRAGRADARARPVGGHGSPGPRVWPGRTRSSGCSMPSWRSPGKTRPMT